MHQHCPKHATAFMFWMVVFVEIFGGMYEGGASNFLLQETNTTATIINIKKWQNKTGSSFSFITKILNSQVKNEERNVLKTQRTIDGIIQTISVVIFRWK